MTERKTDQWGTGNSGNSGKLGDRNSGNSGKLGGNSGTDGTFPRQSRKSGTYELKPRAVCLVSGCGFSGLPPFCGVSRRRVACSRAVMNSTEPSGRPVCVDWRRAEMVSVLSPSAR